MTRLIPGPIWKMARRDITRNQRRWFASAGLIGLAVAAGVYATSSTILANDRSAYLGYRYLNARTLVSASLYGEPTNDGVVSVDDFEGDISQIVDRYGAPSMRVVERYGADDFVTFVDFANPLAEGHSPLSRGRLPGFGEVMVPGWGPYSIGDTVDVPGLGDREVVGVYRDGLWRGVISPEPAPDLRKDVLLAEVRLMYARELDGQSAPTGPDSVPSGWSVELAPIDRDNPVAFSPYAGIRGAGVTGLAAAFVALMVSAVFVVRLRSQLREVGLMAAAGGGEPRHMLLLYLVMGGLVGGVGAVCGGILGIGLFQVSMGLGIYPLSYFGVSNPDQSWFRLEYLAPMLTGIVAAIAASAIAAWQASRLSALDALNSFIPARKPWRFSGAAGISFLLVGFIFASTAWNATGRFGLALGAVAAIGILVGIGSLAVAGISALERAIPNLPLWLRMAVRDANRHRVRSGLAAVTISLVLVTAGLEFTYYIEWLPAFLIGPRLLLWLLGPVALVGIVGLFVYLAMSEVQQTVALVAAVGAVPRSRKLYAGATALVLIVTAAIPGIPAFGLLALFSENPVAKSLVAVAGLGVVTLVVPVLVGLASSARTRRRVARV
ncbi:MAG: hypothetical protein JJE47_00145 [Acidimicrobiia bacterium]|nr:hypothetical protein [Acidimicrobiia bacterium]